MSQNINIQNFYTFLKKNNMDIKEYQVQGVKWAVDKEINGTNIFGVNINGGIIADEMGLGKTIQAIGIILSNIKRHTLIVLPLILLQQWKDIFIKTLGHSPLIYHGNMKKKITIQKILKSPVVLTTYGSLANRNNSLLYHIQWDRVIFDEAHHLRNKNTKIYTSALVLFEISKNASKWMITGTPIQNYINDIINICNILNVPFQALYHEKNCEIIAPIIIRRTKQQIGIRIPNINLSEQMVTWKNKHEKTIAINVHKSDIIIDPLIRTIRSRQMCIYPPILKNIYNTIDNTCHTKIIEVTNKIIERKNNGNKKIVFCHFKKEINQIHKILNENLIYTKIIDGSTNNKERYQIINNTKLQVIILQVQTTSEGLNLQHYNEVYFVSPHWNPAIEDQAIARCHRIGQKKDVIVYKFIMDYFEKPNNEDEYNTYTTIDIKCNMSQKNKRNIAKTYLRE
jgi:SNF2 family DNA or RNA helicase